MRRTKRLLRRPVDAAGSALLIAMMVMVVVTLLGITYLFQADTENLIARNERDRAQVLGMAEAGVRMVKFWYDNPIRDDITTPSHRFLNTYDLRKLKHFDVAQRLINHDGDPGTAPLSSGDVGWEYYQQGRLVSGSPVSDSDADHAISLFQKPYRGSFAAALMGTENGPDILIDENSASADVQAFLAAVNATLFGDINKTGRITRIELYEPPHVNIGGVWERFGIGTVKVTASKFRVPPGGGQEKIAERVVKAVLNEAPYPGPGGPLESCQGIQSSGTFEAHWGKVTAMADVTINTAALDAKWDSAIPLAPDTTPGFPFMQVAFGVPWIAGGYTQDVGAGAGTVIEDPWLSLRTIGFITDAGSTDRQAWPSDWEEPAVPPAYDEDRDHSNLIQQDGSVTCPDFPYELWKSVAKDGGKQIHHLTHVLGDQFREGTLVKTFQDWTHDETGFFFFDTTNNKAPDGTNLTPAININGAWATRGFIYLNAQNFRTTGVSGADIPMISPGEPYNDIFTGGSGFSGTYNAEPWVDVNSDGIFDPLVDTWTDTLTPQGGTDGVYDAEPWVNLDYDTTMGGGGDPPDHRVVALPGNETATINVNGISVTRTTTDFRDADGLPVQHEVNLYGVMYNSGAYSAQGNGQYFGSVIAAGGVGEDFFGAAAAGNPGIYFDERLVKGEWPPPELGLPLTIITVWKTD